MLLGLRGEDGATLKMQGRAVYKFAVAVVPEMLESLMEIAKLQADDIDHVVAHQANKRILEAAANRSGVALEKWFKNLEEFGNTSAASIAIALAEMDEKHYLKPGDKLMLLGFGGGLTYGGIYLTWA